MRVCSIDGCDRKYRARGLCAVHYNKNLSLRVIKPLYRRPHGSACSIDGCEKPYLCKDMCERHYRQHKKYGHIVATYKDIYPIDRFSQKTIRKENGCIEWTGVCTKEGYGSISINNRKIRTHRFAYNYYIGDIPEGLLVCHHCDNPRCCNPQHLFLGTNQDNADDKVRKNRHPRTRSHKLTESDVIKIKKLLEQGERYRDIGKKFNVSTSPICKINKGEYL
jgi:hypothetical protein